MPTVAVVGALLVIAMRRLADGQREACRPRPLGVALSWTDSATVAVPAAVGVPLMVSVAPFALAVSPAGSPVTAAQV